MANDYNEPREEKASGDLDIDDIGLITAKETIDLDPRSLPMIVLAIVICGVAATLFASIAQTVTALVIALLFALALDPLIVKVQYLSFSRLPIEPKLDDKGKPKERIGRYSAVTIVLGSVIVLLSIGAYLIAPTVVDQVKDIPQQIPKTVEGLKDLPIIGDKIASEEAQQNIEDALKALPKRLSAQNSPLGSIFKSLVNGAYLGLLFILMFVTLLLDGPRMVRNVRRLIPPKNRNAADRIAHATYRVIGKYMAGSVFVATMAGLVITTAGLIIGVPLAPLLGMWIVFTNLIPQIGGFLGGAPFVIFGFTASPMKGLICLAVFLCYQQIENHLIQPIVVGKTVKISPPVTMVAALVGVGAGGVLGAMLAVPLVGATKALAAEFDFPRGARAKTLAYDKEDEKKRTAARVKKSKA